VLLGSARELAFFHDSKARAPVRMDDTESSGHMYCSRPGLSIEKLFVLLKPSGVDDADITLHGLAAWAQEVRNRHKRYELPVDGIRDVRGWVTKCWSRRYRTKPLGSQIRH
jgi:hypothetical protein